MDEVEAVVWPRPGVVEVGALPRPAPGLGEVCVRMTTTVVSSGTERARFLALPNASVGFPHVPGYLGAGVLDDGRRVAVRGASHQAVVVAPAAMAATIPDGVTDVDGALWQLGLTALQGLRRGGYQPGDPLAVVGAGLLGAIVRRAATAQGSRCAVVTRSRQKAWSLAAEHGVELWGGNDQRLPGAPLVVDATGTADGLHTAQRLVSPAGTVVLLGSPRAPACPVDAADLHDRGIRLVGAHVDTLELERAAGHDAVPDLTSNWFALLSEGLSFADLVEVRPFREAPFVYRRLAYDRSMVGAGFSWTLRAAPGPAASTRGRPSTRPMRVGLVGCGDIGHFDASVVSASSRGVLTACFDAAPGLAESTAAEFGARAAASLDELLGADDVEAVLVATPHDAHEAVALAAIEAGKHVLLEKPLAASLDAAARIAAAARRATHAVGVLFPLRFDARLVAARDALAEGLLGDPIGLLSTYLVDKPPSYFYGGYTNRSPSTWRLSKKRSGGGVVITNLLHHVDAARALLGREPDMVFAKTSPSAAAEEIEDAASVVASFGGIVATFVGAATVVGGPGEGLTVWGTAGRATVLPAWAGASLRGEMPAPDTPATEGACAAAAVDDFLRAAAEGLPPAVSADDGLRTQAVVDAVYRSASLGAPVSLSDGLGP